MGITYLLSIVCPDISTDETNTQEISLHQYYRGRADHARLHLASNLLGSQNKQPSPTTCESPAGPAPSLRVRQTPDPCLPGTWVPSKPRSTRSFLYKNRVCLVSSLASKFELQADVEKKICPVVLHRPGIGCSCKLSESWLVAPVSRLN